MNIHRNVTSKINWVIDNLIPPIFLDNNFFMGIIMAAIFGKKKKYFMEFKEKSPYITQKEYEEYYDILQDVHIKRATDLNDDCIKKILKNIKGNKILDIGSGRGYLASLIVKMNKNKKVTGLDISIPKELQNSKNPIFIEGAVEKLPFLSRSFDTVICTHTIEHVLKPEKSISEMRRVAKQKIIIVVPRQREYRYTFDLHLNFFPYLYDFLRITKNKSGKGEIINNDIYYEENIS